MAIQPPLGCLTACALTIVFGITLLSIASVYTNEISGVRYVWIELYSIAIFSIVIGSFAIVFAAALIYVVMQQHPVLTALFSGLLLFTAFLALICGVVSATSCARLGATTFNRTEKLFLEYFEADPLVRINKTVIKFQQTFHCCGVTGPEDWVDRYPDGITVSDSCCVTMSIGCGDEALYNDTNIYQKGCVTQAHDILLHDYVVLCSLNFTILIVALCGAVFGIIYERFIREQYEAM